MHNSTKKAKSVCKRSLQLFDETFIKERIKTSNASSDSMRYLSLRANSSMFMLIKLEQELDLTSDAKRIIRDAKKELEKRIYCCNSYFLSFKR